MVCDPSNAFQGSRESRFSSTFSFRLCQGGPEYEVGIYNSLLIQKSRHQSQVSRGNRSVRPCQEDNEVLCVQTGLWVPVTLCPWKPAQVLL